MRRAFIHSRRCLGQTARRGNRRCELSERLVFNDRFSRCKLCWRGSLDRWSRRNRVRSKSWRRRRGCRRNWNGRGRRYGLVHHATSGLVGNSRRRLLGGGKVIEATKVSKWSKLWLRRFGSSSNTWFQSLAPAACSDCPACPDCPNEPGGSGCTGGAGSSGPGITQGFSPLGASLPDEGSSVTPAFIRTPGTSSGPWTSLLSTGSMVSGVTNPGGFFHYGHCRRRFGRRRSL